MGGWARTAEYFLHGLIGFDVAWYGGEAEKGTDKERGDLDHG